MPKTNGNLALSPYDEIFKNNAPSEQNESVVEIPLNELFPFDNHPFQVRDDEEMKKTAESIEKYGVIMPGLVRPRQSGGYEIIAGHRRKRGCEIANKETMPVIIREMDDDEATIIMVDSNLQREKLLPSEKAWAFRMKLEAMNHRGMKVKGFDTGVLSVEVLAEQVGESKSQIYRYVRLTELVPDILDMVDNGKISFGPAVEISELSRKKQAVLIDMMSRHEATPSLSQAKRLKKHHKENTLTNELIDEIMSEVKKETLNITISENKLFAYFPQSYTPNQMENIIIGLLEQWKNEQVSA